MKVLETNFSSLYLLNEYKIRPSSIQQNNFVDTSNLASIKVLQSHDTLSHQANERLGMLKSSSTGSGLVFKKKKRKRKSSPVHIAPACAGPGEGSDQFGSYVQGSGFVFTTTKYNPGNNLKRVIRTRKHP
jgi:hypothetical protein